MQTSPPHIHFFIGTKAQLIKMAPIMLEMRSRGIPFRLINAGQHAGSIPPLLEAFRLPRPDVALHSGQENISTPGQALVWLAGLLWSIVAEPRRIRETVFGNQKGVCLIHGDTVTTLVSLLMAKQAGLSVAHIEAGYRSFNLLDPFPEELIRIIAMRFSNLLFAPTEITLENLAAMRIGGTVIYLGANTIEDAVAYAHRMNEDSSFAPTGEAYAVMSIHRFETVRSRKRLTQIVRWARQIGERLPLKFVMHSPTLHYLRRFKLLSQLEDDDRIELLPLQPYLSFVALLDHAEFIVTDGGSIQEEAYVLGAPCLILRARTEHEEGVGENAVLGGFDQERIRAFLDHYDAYRRQPKRSPQAASPSARLVDTLLEWMPTQVETES